MYYISVNVPDDDTGSPMCVWMIITSYTQNACTTARTTLASLHHSQNARTTLASIRLCGGVGENYGSLCGQMNEGFLPGVFNATLGL